jgi:hypothetical protein
MKRSTALKRLLGGVSLTLALAACSDSPLAPNGPALEALRGGAILTEFTATDIPTGILDPGTMEVVEGHRVVRGMVVTTRITADDPRATGNGRMTINQQFLLADGSGHTWGKFEVTADVGGVWVGSYTGQREPAAPGVWVTTLHVVGQGRGGAIDGLQLRTQEVAYSGAGPGFQAYITGTILEPR